MARWRAALAASQRLGHARASAVGSRGFEHLREEQHDQWTQPARVLIFSVILMLAGCGRVLSAFALGRVFAAGAARPKVPALSRCVTIPSTNQDVEGAIAMFC